MEESSNVTIEKFDNTELKEILGSEYLIDKKTFTLPVEMIENPSLDIIITYFGNIVKNVKKQDSACSFDYLTDKDLYYINNMKDKLEKSKIEICNCIYKNIIDVFNTSDDVQIGILTDLTQEKCDQVIKDDIFNCIKMILNFIQINTIKIDDNSIGIKTKTDNLYKNDNDPRKKLLCILYILHNTTLSLSTFSKKTISYDWNTKIDIKQIDINANDVRTKKYHYDKNYTVIPKTNSGNNTAATAAAAAQQRQQQHSSTSPPQSE